MFCEAGVNFYRRLSRTLFSLYCSRVFGFIHSQRGLIWAFLVLVFAIYMTPFKMGLCAVSDLVICYFYILHINYEKMRSLHMVFF